jgi:histidyl-tRNA synthetase
MTEKSIEIAQQLRKEGIITEVDILHRGVGKSLKHANSKNSEKAIIIGPKELERDSVTLRDMKTGDQQLVKIAEILAKLKNN